MADDSVAITCLCMHMHMNPLSGSFNKFSFFLLYSTNIASCIHIYSNTPKDCESHEMIWHSQSDLPIFKFES